jgi:hypothetical protein
VPPVAVMMVKRPESHNYRLSHLKDIVIGAAAVSAQLEDMLLDRYPGSRVRQSKMYLCYFHNFRVFINE